MFRLHDPGLSETGRPGRLDRPDPPIIRSAKKRSHPPKKNPTPRIMPRPSDRGIPTNGLMSLLEKTMTARPSDETSGLKTARLLKTRRVQAARGLERGGGNLQRILHDRADSWKAPDCPQGYIRFQKRCFEDRMPLIHPRNPLRNGPGITSRLHVGCETAR
jgi:hypothetical protein